jgi:hypothetical protein
LIPSSSYVYVHPKVYLSLAVQGTMISTSVGAPCCLSNLQQNMFE